MNGSKKVSKDDLMKELDGLLTEMGMRNAMTNITKCFLRGNFGPLKEYMGLYVGNKKKKDRTLQIIIELEKK